MKEVSFRVFFGMESDAELEGYLVSPPFRSVFIDALTHRIEDLIRFWPDGDVLTLAKFVLKADFYLEMYSRIPGLESREFIFPIGLEHSRKSLQGLRDRFLQEDGVLEMVSILEVMES